MYQIKNNHEFIFTFFIEFVKLNNVCLIQTYQKQG